ncbi:hypothetical protein DFA_08615 [Cavenderia fasciculata]|uniref:Uncharacterized protein n=1 Tax=Cavenderia fasciculata TaxID=261658 RepID=F4Q3A9_CACFS|nr:uncharacterized protein DFA_08615 [Cavenderia fasciculata]EGG17619.1 hypothetical protein DFA_08615 [Cavenderia fasciculata]|eukprot:XP_004356103.1 hypothetical protein DFA_08615 [Cavenderia fasciculata]
MDQVIEILLSNKYRQCKPVFPASGVPREFSTSWIQFFHDLMMLSSGVRDAYLIDYPIPEYNNLVSFYKVFRKRLIARLQRDVETGFTDYQFINVSSRLEQAQLCQAPSHHILSLSNIAKSLVTKISSMRSDECAIKLMGDCCTLEQVNLQNIYAPIVAGWLCNYAIIYCNSANNQDTCCCPDKDGVYSDRDTFWQKNCIAMSDLLKVQVQLESLTPSYSHLSTPQLINLPRLYSFSIPLHLLNNETTTMTTTKEHFENWKSKQTKQWSIDMVNQKIWKSINIISTPISNLTINL